MFFLSLFTVCLNLVSFCAKHEHFKRQQMAKRPKLGRYRLNDVVRKIHTSKFHELKIGAD